jgi:hypothetical protein
MLSLDVQGDSVPKLLRSRTWMRPWVAAAAAHAVALQMMLASFAVVHFAAASDPSTFVTCLGHSATIDSGQGDTGRQPVDEAPCVFCTLTVGAAGLLPAAPTVSMMAVSVPADFEARHDPIAARHFPSDQRQRGPPAADPVTV